MDKADLKVLGYGLVYLVAAVFGLAGLGLAFGLMTRIFLWAAGL